MSLRYFLYFICVVFFIFSLFCISLFCFNSEKVGEGKQHPALVKQEVLIQAALTV